MRTRKSDACFLILEEKLFSTQQQPDAAMDRFA